MSQAQTVRAGELVSIAERQRYMQAFRIVLVIAAAAIAAAVPHDLVVPRALIAETTAGFALLAVLGHLATRAARKLGTAIFGAMLIMDGVYLAWASYATGGTQSPLRYMILLHLIATCLLASYRTGLKLALWHSMLLIGVFDMGAIGFGTPFQRLLEFSALFWLVAIATSSLSAVNERELRRRRYDLEALAAMATRLESVSEPADVAEAVLDAVCDAFDFERAVLLAAANAHEAPAPLAWRGEVAHQASGPAPGERSVVSVARAERRPQLVRALDTDTDPWLAELLPGARNLVVVPLSAEGHSFGALVAEHPGRMGTRIERRVVGMVERFVSHGTLAIRNAWLLEQVRRMAATDGLTGVANRATFDETMRKELGRAGRRGEDVTLLMLDIDHFKRLNDNYGHQTGDDVLRRVAATLAELARDYDTVARYGGEEFGIVLPGAAREQSLQVAERMRIAIARAAEEPSVTVSIGTATFPLDGTQPEDLVAAADEALYESKGSGRNRVTSSRRHELGSAA
jgi:two-component system, cell cycle response regulator